MVFEDRKKSNNREYTNGEITVYWRPSKCIHVTTCYRELIEVFNPRKRPWINMKGASTEEIIRVVDKCPTDALTYSWNHEKDNDKKEAEAKPEEQPAEQEVKPKTEVRVMKDGPLLVKGDFAIYGANGEKLQSMKIASFCRCGQSLKMPFCDGTHRKIRFTSR